MSAREEWKDCNKLSIENWHEYVMTQLKEAAEGTLSPVYEQDIHSWECDLWIGDMPWTEDEWKVVANNLTQHPEFESTAKRYEEVWGRDMWNVPPEMMS